MITSNDSSKSNEVRQQYQALFDKYNETIAQIPGLNENDWSTVETLADYFGNMGTIKDVFLSNDDSSAYKDYYDPSYIRLPLDEEPFIIDADKRTITVPAAFKNGICVEGDHACETLYFKIARYFDGIDFNEMQIRIQCENANGDQYFYPESFRDVNSEAGFIIFGWSLDDKVSEKSGNIKFSVRIFSTSRNDDNEIVVNYSFSTLAQTAVINPSMNYSFAGDVELATESNWILSQIKNSSNTTGTPAATPLILSINNETDLTKASYEYDLVNGSKALDVLGGTTDTGTISYKWASAQQQSHLTNGENGLNNWVETADTALVTGKKYYVAVGSDYSVDLTVTDSKLAASHDTTDANRTVYYEKHNVNNVNLAGEYSCIVTNTLKTKPSSKTVKFVIPGPSEDGAIAYPSAYNGLIDNNIVHVIVPSGTNTVTLVASATLGNANDSVNYIWKSYPDNESKGAGSELVLSNLSADVNEKYYAIVEETRNGASVVLKDASTQELHTKYYQVSYAPQKISVNITANPALTDQSIVKGNSVILSASKSNNPPSESLSYQWYKAVGEVGGEDDIALDGQTSSTLSTTSLEVGRYYCIITNSLNGQSTKSDPSAVYTITE